MTAIKFVLLLAIVVLLWAFRNRSRVGLRASFRLVLAALVVLAVASIIDPGLTQKAADLLGVTRGTDLVLYAAVVVFGATALGSYFRFRDLERRIADLTRTEAIREAVRSQGLPGAQAGRGLATDFDRGFESDSEPKPMPESD